MGRFPQFCKIHIAICVLTKLSPCLRSYRSYEVIATLEVYDNTWKTTTTFPPRLRRHHSIRMAERFSGFPNSESRCS